MTTIEEGNRLIAEFMGGTRLAGRQENVYWFSDHHHILTSHKSINVHAFKYLTSYDWLMPVILKLQATTSEDIQQFDGHVIFELGLCTPIAELWQAVVEFIQWYNQNPATHRINNNKII